MMKIEEAILYVLAERNGGLRTEQIADIINRRKLHVRKDGQPVTSARATTTVIRTGYSESSRFIIGEFAHKSRFHSSLQGMVSKTFSIQDLQETERFSLSVWHIQFHCGCWCRYSRRH